MGRCLNESGDSWQSRRFKLNRGISPSNRNIAKVTIPKPISENKLLAVVEPPKPAESPKPAEDDFNWADDDSIILRPQPETAAYFNKEGALVIRQRNWPEDDSFIFIAEANIGEFLDKITDVCGIPSVGGPKR